VQSYENNRQHTWFLERALMG